MSETPPAEMADGRFDHYDDERELYFWRDERADSKGVIYSRPYTAEEVAGKAKRAQLDGLRVEAEGAIPYLDERIDVALAYLEIPEPTSEEMAAQLKNLADLAAYSAGTLKRVIVVLGELTGRPV
ncbi:hypothetical protein KGG72_gp42 [Streptomyces phage Salutena]|uniref:Uncharacterized protein n=1 Tax=Streptomyces phage Salutena TaxID=2767576 RepID=A0A7S6R853_9CAUD|nr:hypothetical protein KGG72_gp42 [Streptomyces phage Salutena]QOV06172.1 hypothetical protein CPT_Salutena_042 [Streptomyces phage Salutena]